MKLGLQTRLLLTTTLVLGSFLGAVGWVLDRSFNASVLAGAEEQMTQVVNGLLSNVEDGDGFLGFSDELADPRLSGPSMGLYAEVQDFEGTVVWRSPSAIASQVNVPSDRLRPLPGQSRFDVAQLSVPRFLLGYTVIWESLDDAEFTFWILEDQAPFRAEIAGFRRNVMLGLAGSALLFVVIQLVALRWGLRPVRSMSRRIQQLEDGEAVDIGGDYPRELSGLARNLNRFIAHETENRDRYRRAMDDLAHSLKTPLAVLRNEIPHLDANDGRLFGEQLDRMETTVTHQLSRAAAIGHVIPSEAISVADVAARLARALERAYADKGVTISIVDSDTRVRVDERDLMEILGNLIENAAKYSKSEVRVSAQQGACVRVLVEDDGPGIPVDARRAVLRRGARADTAEAGQGLGLALVVELVEIYEGTLAIDDSDLGGARMVVEFPR